MHVASRVATLSASLPVVTKSNCLKRPITTLVLRSKMASDYPRDSLDAVLDALFAKFDSKVSDSETKKVQTPKKSKKVQTPKKSKKVRFF